MKSIILIPASMESTRLPGKPLIDINGKPLVQWTWEAAKRTRADHVVVLSDSREVAKAVEQFSGTFWPSPPGCRSGTHRCYDAAFRFQPNTIRIVINWQVDEPLVRPEDVNKLFSDVKSYSGAISTLAAQASLDNSFVCGVRSPTGRCYWFSRARMAGGFDHIGVYGYSIGTLFDIGPLEPTPLSLAESLEQLTWLENDYVIRAVNASHPLVEVNTQEDLVKIREILK